MNTTSIRAYTGTTEKLVLTLRKTTLQSGKIQKILIIMATALMFMSI